MSISVKANACPKCGKKLDAVATTIEDVANVEPGFIVLCFYCGSLLCYEDDLSIRMATPDEIAIVQKNQPGCIAESRSIIAKSKGYPVNRN
jgi:hypothetical protein